MKNKKGQSLLEIIFSIGVVVLVLTGVAILVVNATKAKRISLEREKAVELSQILIENKVLEIKNNSFIFWNGASDLDGQVISNNNGSNINSKFTDYLYDVEYKNCNSESCNIVFIVRWNCLSGVCQNLLVERLFSKLGT